MSAFTFKELAEPKAKHTFSVYKSDDDERLVFGWANVAVRQNGEEVVDLQEDSIDPDDLEAAVYEYVLQFGDGGEEHNPSRRRVARLVESCVFTPQKLNAMGLPERSVPFGWWIGFRVLDDDTWAKIKDGTFRMFSIEGTGRRIQAAEGGEES